MKVSLHQLFSNCSDIPLCFFLLNLLLLLLLLVFSLGSSNLAVVLRLISSSPVASWPWLWTWKRCPSAEEIEVTVRRKKGGKQEGEKVNKKKTPKWWSTMGDLREETQEHENMWQKTLNCRTELKWTKMVSMVFLCRNKTTKTTGRERGKKKEECFKESSISVSNRSSKEEMCRNVHHIRQDGWQSCSIQSWT